MNKQEFLAFSLPYGLKVKFITERIQSYSSVKYEAEFENELESIKSIPILRPLSDLKDKDTESVGFQTILKVASKVDNGEWLRLLCGNYKPEQLPFYVFEILIQNNFDIANLIEQGEAIDYHTLEGFSF